MISAGDAEFPRDYHTLAAGGGRGARRFTDSTNGGFTAASLDRRHNSVAAKSLEALNSIHKADIERQRDALMDLQKNKFSNSPGSLSQGSAPAGRQVRDLHTQTPSPERQESYQSVRCNHVVSAHQQGQITKVMHQGHRSENVFGSMCWKQENTSDWMKGVRRGIFPT